MVKMVCAAKTSSAPRNPLPGWTAQRDEGQQAARPRDRPVHGAARAMRAAVPANRDDRRDGVRDRGRRLGPGEATSAGPWHQPCRRHEQPRQALPPWRGVAGELDVHAQAARTHLADDGFDAGEQAAVWAPGRIVRVTGIAERATAERYVPAFVGAGTLSHHPTGFPAHGSAHTACYSG